MTKKKNSVGYFSAYYRGLECLLKVWPKIREQVPDATLDIYYGWQSWVNAEGEDAFYHRMLDKLEELKDQGVIEHGRVSHIELAKHMKETKVWTYPTSFSEIHCITALKANAAHCKPVITDVAALTETGGPVADYIETEKIELDEYAQKKFIDAVVKALKTDLTEEELQKQTDFVNDKSWTQVAKQWSEAING